MVGNAAATELRSRPFLERIRALGYGAALVAQDGMEWSTWDCWDEIDALFIGGSTAWKLGPYAAELAAVARSVGRWVHMGRVNSGQRWEHAAAIGCDSVDGTFVTYAPDANLPKILGWLRVREQAALIGDHRELYGPPECWDGGALYAAASEELRLIRAAGPVAVNAARRAESGSQLDLFGAAA